jgi:5'-nucleotidase
MLFSKAVAPFGAFAVLSQALNILLNNDDGFGSANTRELYRVLRAAGHDAWMVAPAVDNSGQGGRFILTTYANLTNSTEFDLVPAGAPSLGPDPHDNHIWYYNGTPAACTAVGLDYVLPNFADFDVPDLFLSGPNFGDNVGTFAFTGSGTIGATYYAIERNIPGIAFSGANPTQSYTTLTNTTNPATWAAELSVELVERLVNNTKAGERLLPLGYGLNVNYPPLNSSCQSPPFIQSRFSGGSGMPQIYYNTSTGLVGIPNNNYFGLVPAGANQCYNGDCGFPGESVVVTACETSVTIFTVDYDAPRNAQTAQVENSLGFSVGRSGGHGWGHGHGWPAA